MVAIQIRDVPERVRDALAQEAERRGTSLQFFLAEVLRREAASAANLAWLEDVRRRPPRIAEGVDISELIREGRAERDRQILGAIGISAVEAVRGEPG
ncbi:MAG: hypothetical protein ABIR17_08125 [Pseudolysinimonas sp.]|uniref:hypothetical protein n=1 Tax=Pseudolysinimonas sp. TaxID=2680009 RepID=UPI003263BC53